MSRTSYPKLPTTQSYPERSRAPKATRWSTKSSNQAAQSSRRGCGEFRGLLRSPEHEGEARRTFQATGAERLEAQPARIGEPHPPRRKLLGYFCVQGIRAQLSE
ncbi:hypothetical protein F2Q69_00028772 [Brassica cretica]|uniref:Uncharacterized protein n=1 Tax=Brassica cretica TaxID=69181 RepID=A0A8S9SBY5_BRACR|nr:hypothetical protein F2Q69_00028772 [Brassica cretica]